MSFKQTFKKDVKLVLNPFTRILDRIEGGFKKVDAAKKAKNNKMMQDNFGGVEQYHNFMTRNRLK